MRYKPNYLRDVVRRFENAARSDDFKGTIPRGESQYARDCYQAVEDEYASARAALLRLMDGLNDSALPRYTPIRNDLTALTTALFDSENTARPSEHPEEMQEYRERAHKIVYQLQRLGWRLIWDTSKGE